MSILGIIAEYNPFHFGHKYQLNRSKKETGSNYVVSVMSGSFVQRGEPAFLDKWSRARMAIDGGVDLVLELPVIYSTQTAELFAYGGVKLLNSLNIVDYLSFGTEIGDLENLKTIANVLVNEPKEFIDLLRFYLDQGLSFPISRSKALNKYLPSDINASIIVSNPNNILAIEYLKSLEILRSDIIPHTIKRVGADYSSKDLNEKFSSATGIRESIIKHGINSVENYLPISSFHIMKDFYNKFGEFNSLYNYEQILLYILRTTESENMSELIDVEHGLGNRILNKSSSSSSLSQIVQNSISKTHTRTRIQRTLIHLLLELNKQSFNNMHQFYPSYTRVLASNKNGLYLLNKIKANSGIPIITKFSNYVNLSSDEINQIISFDKKATDIFYLGFGGKNNMDFLTSPYIKK